MKKKFSLKEEYKKSFYYIRESRKFIYSIIAIFFVFALIGFFVPVPNSIVEQILKFVQELMEKTQGMSYLELTQFIFLNNIQSSFMAMMFGMLFGILPIIAAIGNGYVLGFVALLSVKEHGIFVLWRLLPHGLFELPAIFISLGIGLKFGTFIFQKKKFDSFKNYFWNSLRIFFFVVLPLLILAAIIEGSLISFFR